jgi:hypothetical protein
MVPTIKKRESTAVMCRKIEVLFTILHYYSNKFGRINHDISQDYMKVFGLHAQVIKNFIDAV